MYRKRRWLGKDFHKKSLQNPFGRIELHHARNVRRNKRARILLFFVIGGWIYFLFFSPVFAIQNIVVQSSGSDISKDDVAQLLREQIGQRTFFIFPGDNVFLLREKRFIKNFHKRYFVEQLEISKRYPNTISIYIEEKEPRAILLLERDDIFLDNRARIIQITQHQNVASSTTFVEHANAHNEDTLPIIVTKILKLPEIRDEAIPENIFNNILLIDEKIRGLTAVGIRYFVYEKEEILKIIVKTKIGFEIYFDTDDIEKEMSKLTAFLQTKDEKERASIQYIDLRFGDRIYIK